MAEHTRDGGVIPSGMPRSDRNMNESRQKFGLYRGQVIDTVFPADPRNASLSRVE